MGTILIDQYILCDSFPTAKAICSAFADFKIRQFYFGGTQAIKARRFIRKAKSKTFSHYALIRYSINFKGAFCTYGFIDEKSIKRYPELPDTVGKCPIDDRWRIISEYEEKDDDCYDIYFYKNFEDFYKNKVIDLLNRIDMACKVSFSCKYHTEFFQIYYEECGQAYERGFWANNENHGLSMLGIANVPGAIFSPIQLQSIWNWAEENYYNKRNNWYSEARAWAALSYAINRDGYESLLYSIMGLEAVYTKDDKMIKQQLKDSIPKVIGYISEEEINELYKLRSEFVHGDIAYPMCGKDDHDYSKNALVQKAAVVLLETIRLLVQNNATKIRVINGHISYICDRTLREDMEKYLIEEKKKNEIPQ